MEQLSREMLAQTGSMACRRKDAPAEDTDLVDTSLTDSRLKEAGDEDTDSMEVNVERIKVAEAVVGAVAIQDA